jgi:SAM-dependent methyltransferase
MLMDAETASALDDDTEGQDEQFAVAASVQIPPKPRCFREAASIDYFLALIRAGKSKKAGTYLVEILPELAASGLHPQEKLNHLIYLPRLIQRGGTTKHGAQKLLRKMRVVERNIAGNDLPEDGAFVDFGCGAHDPLAMASYFYANGFEKAYAIDLLGPRSELYTALAMYDLLANMRLFPQRYCRPGVGPGTILERIGIFDAEAFEAADLGRGMAGAAGKLCHEAVDIVASSIEPESVSLLVSSAVLEHVSDLDGVCKKIYDSLMPGGIAYHFIDMADHRSYRDNGQFGPLSFLTEEEAPPNMNRLRKSDQIAAQERAGFEIVKASSINAELTDDVREKLIERFRGRDDDDISTVKMNLTVRKPAPVT